MCHSAKSDYIYNIISRCEKKNQFSCFSSVSAAILLKFHIIVTAKIDSLLHMLSNLRTSFLMYVWYNGAQGGNQNPKPAGVCSGIANSVP